MFFYDSFTDPQPQSVSVISLCRFESFKQVSFDFCAHAAASISQGNSHTVLTCLRMQRCTFAQENAPAVASRVKSISDQVGKDLPEFAGVTDKRGGILVAALYLGLRSGKPALIEDENRIQQHRDGCFASDVALTVIGECLWAISETRASSCCAVSRYSRCSEFSGVPSRR